MNSAVYNFIERIQACFGRYERDEDKAKNARVFLSKLPKKVMIMLITALQGDKGKASAGAGADAGVDAHMKEATPQAPTSELGIKRQLHDQTTLDAADDDDKHTKELNAFLPFVSTSKSQSGNNDRASSLIQAQSNWFASRKRVNRSTVPLSSPPINQSNSEWEDMGTTPQDASTSMALSNSYHITNMPLDELSWISIKWAVRHNAFRPFTYYAIRNCLRTEALLVKKQDISMIAADGSQQHRESFSIDMLLNDFGYDRDQDHDIDLHHHHSNEDQEEYIILDSGDTTSTQLLDPEDTRITLEWCIDNFSSLALRHARNTLIMGVPVRLTHPYFPYRMYKMDVLNKAKENEKAQSIMKSEGDEQYETNLATKEDYFKNNTSCYSSYPVWAREMISFDKAYGIRARMYLPPKLSTKLYYPTPSSFSSSLISTTPMLIQAQLVDIWKAIVQTVFMPEGGGMREVDKRNELINVNINSRLLELEGGKEWMTNSPLFQIGLILDNNDGIDTQLGDNKSYTPPHPPSHDDHHSHLTSLVYPLNLTSNMRPSISLWRNIKSSHTRSYTSKQHRDHRRVPTVMTAFDALSLVTEIAKLLFICGCHPIRPTAAMVMAEIFSQRHGNMLIRESLYDAVMDIGIPEIVNGNGDAHQDTTRRRLENYSGSISPLELFHYLDSAHDMKLQAVNKKSGLARDVRQNVRQEQQQEQEQGPKPDETDDTLARSLLLALGVEKAGVSKDDEEYLILARSVVKVWEERRRVSMEEVKVKLNEDEKDEQEEKSQFMKDEDAEGNVGSRYNSISVLNSFIGRGFRSNRRSKGKKGKTSTPTGIWPSIDWLVRSFPLEYHTFMHWNKLHAMAKRDKKDDKVTKQENQEEKEEKQQDKEYHAPSFTRSNEGLKKVVIMDNNSIKEEDELKGKQGNSVKEEEEEEVGEVSTQTNKQGVKNEIESEEEKEEDSAQSDNEDEDEEDDEDDDDDDDDLNAQGLENDIEEDIELNLEDEPENDLVKEEEDIDENVLNLSQTLQCRQNIAWALTRGVNNHKVDTSSQDHTQTHSHNTISPYHQRLPRLIKLEQSLTKAEYHQYCACRTSLGDLSLLIKFKRRNIIPAGWIYMVTQCMQKAIRTVLLRASMLNLNDQQMGSSPLSISTSTTSSSLQRDKDDQQGSTNTCVSSKIETPTNSGNSYPTLSASSLTMFRLFVSFSIIDRIVETATIIRRSAVYHRLAHEYFALAYTTKQMQPEGGVRDEDKDNIIRIWIDATRKSLSVDRAAAEASRIWNQQDGPKSAYVDVDIPSLVFANVLLDTHCYF